MIAKPIISPDFTIEDIHKIREYHYELTKDMTTQERINFYNEGGRAFLKEMEESYRKCNDYGNIGYLLFLILQIKIFTRSGKRITNGQKRTPVVALATAEGSLLDSESCAFSITA